MPYVHLRPTTRLVDTHHRDGHTLWRTEIEVAGRMVDATAWADHAPEAIADGRRLASEWGQLRRWVTDDEHDATLLDLATATFGPVHPEPPEAA